MSKRKKLTTKQEKFCQGYIELGNAAEAYRRSYNAGKMKTTTVQRKAMELLENGMITARIAELQAEHREKHGVTVESITKMYLEDRELAHSVELPGAAVSATTGLARLYGLDKQVHHIESDPIKELLEAVAGSSVGPPSERRKT